MKTFIRPIRWLVFNGLFALMLWLWLARGVEGAHHVAVFYVWFVFIVSLGTLSKKTREALRSKGKPPVPVWLDLIFDAAMASIMVWCGWTLLGAIYLFHGLLMGSAWSEGKAPA